MRKKIINFFGECFLPLTLAVTCLALSGCGGKGDTQSSASTDQGNVMSSSEPSMQSKTESGNSKAASTSSTAKPAGTQTAATPKNTSGTVAVTSSQKGETVKKPIASKISKIKRKSNSSRSSGTTSSKKTTSRRYDSDELSRTYVSMPTKTEAQKFAVIEARVLGLFPVKNFPKPKKIVEFSNTPRALWSLAVYSKDDLERIRQLFRYGKRDFKEKPCSVKQLSNVWKLSINTTKERVPWLDSLTEYNTVTWYSTVGGFNFLDLSGDGYDETSQSSDVAVIDYGDKENYYVLFSNECGLTAEAAKHPELYGH